MIITQTFTTASGQIVVKKSETTKQTKDQNNNWGGGGGGSRKKRVNLKQRNTRGKVIVFDSFHFCGWSVWSSMNENLLAATHVLVIKHNSGALYFNVSFY